jgi:serine/threonine-protein kinase
VSLTVVYLIAGAAKPARSAAAGGLDPKRIAVLYFEDQSGSPQLGYLTEGLTDALIAALSTVQGLGVVSRGGVEQFRGDSIPLDSIGRALQAGTLVLGTIEPQRGKDISVGLRLVDGASGSLYKQIAVKGAAEDPLKLRDSLAASAAQLIREWIGQEVKLRSQREGTANAEAWSLLQQAEQAHKRGDAQAAQGDTAAMTREYARADSLAARSEQGDPAWADPIVLRGQLAYGRSYRMRDTPLRASPLIDQGIGHAQRALKVNPNNPDALELLGNCRYWRLLLGLETESGKAKAMLDSAQADLEKATQINPAQAGAWATLSHLYYRTKSNVDVNLAAQNAYRADAFLQNADKILQRLFFSSYDLGTNQFADAAQWCGIGQRRFPSNPKFVECQLLLMTTKARDPDPALAWRLADSLVKLAPAPEREYQQLNGQMLVAAVLARAGQSDSAKRLAGRSEGNAEVDASRDLTLLAAYVYELAGDAGQAIDALKLYFTANPSQRSNFADDPGWMFRDLSADPRFRRLVGSGH